MGLMEYHSEPGRQSYVLWNECISWQNENTAPSTDDNGREILKHLAIVRIAMLPPNDLDD